jgi:hypothetical protein
LQRSRFLIAIKLSPRAALSPPAMNGAIPVVRFGLEVAKIGNEKFFEENSFDDAMHRL